MKEKDTWSRELRTEDMLVQTKNPKVLPKTAAEISNGGLYQQAVRCGKSGCRCALGDLHQGYFYFIRRINGHLRKTYIPKPQVALVGRLVEEARRLRRAEHEAKRSSRRLLSELREKLREHEPTIRTLAEALKQND